MFQDNKGNWMIKREPSWIQRVNDWKIGSVQPLLEDRLRNLDTPYKQTKPTLNRQKKYPTINMPDRSSPSETQDKKPTLNKKYKRQAIYIPDRLLTSDIEDRPTSPSRRQSICLPKRWSPSEVEDSESQSLSDLEDSQLIWNRRNRRSAIYIPDISSTSETRNNPLTWNRQTKRSAIYVPDKQSSSGIRNSNKEHLSHQKKMATPLVPSVSTVPQSSLMVEEPNSKVTIMMVQSNKTVSRTVTRTITKNICQTVDELDGIFDIDPDKV